MLCSNTQAAAAAAPDNAACVHHTSPRLQAAHSWKLASMQHSSCRCTPWQLPPLWPRPSCAPQSPGPAAPAQPAPSNQNRCIGSAAAYASLCAKKTAASANCVCALWPPLACRRFLFASLRMVTGCDFKICTQQGGSRLSISSGRMQRCLNTTACGSPQTSNRRRLPIGQHASLQLPGCTCAPCHGTPP